ncbi:MAG TPA: ferrochelatase [Gemmatimonadales bacterium]|nr:ferrochelatase [Gemmatimonadales bacterium]
MAAPVGVLVMAYGGPESLSDVEPYLLDVRGFRPTPPRVVNEVRERYAQIGGRSPIRPQTEQQARALDAALNTNGTRFTTLVGMRHWHPYIKAALERLEAAGIERAVGLVMAPHYSRLSIERYVEQVAAAGSRVSVAPIREWPTLPGFLDALADRVREGLARFSGAVRDGVTVVFTAHSLPQRIREWQDPYERQLQATVAGVIERLGTRPHRLAFQSAGMTNEPWLGPDVETVVEQLAADGRRDALIAPIGFTSEHVEVLYDLDVELRQRAADLRVRLERIAMVGDHPAMIAGLAELVRATAAGQGWR